MRTRPKAADHELPAEAFGEAYSAGHFYSPYPSKAEVELRHEHLFSRSERDLPGIELNAQSQVALFRELTEEYLPEFPPYEMAQKSGLRYFHDNNFYSRKDAVLLYCMLRHLRPKRIIEVGSGFSSALMLDTNERFFKNEIEITFIEPYPQRLKRLMSQDDRQRARLIQRGVQDVDASVFQELEENDLLFIDSSHVSKVGSDVNYLFFEVLPLLNAGVAIQVHDIFYPFEYLEHWIKKGRAWNEAYLLRAFLQHNKEFSVDLFTSYLLFVYPELFSEGNWPLIPEGGSYGSIWLRRH